MSGRNEKLQDPTAGGPGQRLFPGGHGQRVQGAAKSLREVKGQSQRQSRQKVKLQAEDMDKHRSQ